MPGLQKKAGAIFAKFQPLHREPPSEALLRGCRWLTGLVDLEASLLAPLAWSFSHSETQRSTHSLAKSARS